MKFRNYSVVIFFFFSFLIGNTTALAQSNAVAIQDVQAAAVNDKILFTVKFDSLPPTTVNNFTLPNSNRFVVDFPNTTYAKGRTTITFGNKIIQSVLILPVEGRTRMVFDLNGAFPSKVEIKDKSYLITLG